MFHLNAPHTHILLVHFPIVLSVVAPCMLAYGLFRKSGEIIHISLFLFIIMAVIGIPVFWAWKEAIKTVSAIPGIGIRSLILHERIATMTVWLMFLLGILSAIILYLDTRNTGNNYKNWHYVVFLFSLVVVVAVSFTGYYGGSIRHTEIQ